MTFIGKLLVFFNLVIAIGMAVASTTLYVDRPGWYDEIPEGVDKGQNPLNFKQLKSNTENLTRAANAAGRKWGDGLASLQEREKVREDRRLVYNKRLIIARKGEAKGKYAFYDQALNPATRLIDTAKQGKGIDGPFDLPLAGSEELLPRIQQDVEDIKVIEGDVAKLLSEKEELGHQINGSPAKKMIGLDARRLKQIEIRENLDNELFFLEGFEINWYAQRVTTDRRRKQLTNRLELFKP